MIFGNYDWLSFDFRPISASQAIEHFDFPQPVSEVNLNNQFTNLIDPDSALFLEENNDPFPKSQHGYISDLTIYFDRDSSIAEDRYPSSGDVSNVSSVIEIAPEQQLEMNLSIDLIMP